MNKRGEIDLVLGQDEIQVMRVLVEDAINALNEGMISERWDCDRGEWSNALFTLEYYLAGVNLKD